MGDCLLPTHWLMLSCFWMDAEARMPLSFAVRLADETSLLLLPEDAMFGVVVCLRTATPSWMFLTAVWL